MLTAVLAVNPLPLRAADRPPLIAAVTRGDAPAVAALLAQRIDVNRPEADGTTALHWAARAGDPDTVRALLRAGAAVGAANRYGVTPLSLACAAGHAAIVEALLAGGADPGTAKPGGETALMSAGRAGSQPAVAALLARGADPARADEGFGQTALMWAAGGNHADVVTTLVSAGASLDTRSRAGFTALLFAVRAGQLDAARALLDAGADVNAALPTGVAPLTLAVLNARYAVASMLLDYGADPNAAGQGWTALHQIAWTRRPHVGFNNPEPVQRDDYDSLALVRKLIAFGADPNARMPKVLKEEPRTGLNGLNRTGATPFFLAAKDADVELMRVLAEHGADPLAANADNTTPLMVAAGIGIFTPGEDPGTNEEALAAVKLALELGGSVTAVDDKGDTALHGAAMRGATALAQFLADRGARLDAVNKRGWTPLIIAEGVMLGGTIKRQPETAALLRELLARSSGSAARP